MRRVDSSSSDACISQLALKDKNSFHVRPQHKLPRATTTGSQTTHYSYDALGVRASKTDNGVTTYYLTAQLFGYSRKLMELSADLDINASYVFAGHQVLKEEPVASDPSQDRYLLHDGLVGSVTHALDINGGVSADYRYDAFGLRGGSAARGYGYTGEEHDGITGLIYLRARYYDPRLGRFISADPYWGRLEEPVTQNRYIYVRNNPLGFVDPSGLDTTYLANPNFSPDHLMGKVFGEFWNKGVVPAIPTKDEAIDGALAVTSLGVGAVAVGSGVGAAPAFMAGLTRAGFIVDGIAAYRQDDLTQLAPDMAGVAIKGKAGQVTAFGLSVFNAFGGIDLLKKSGESRQDNSIYGCTANSR